MKMCEISVITPLYNTEQYLFECLNSLYLNDLEGVEHILINDGSPGFSEEIKLRISNEYKHTVIISKEKNEGIGMAYKDALSIAQGKYIMFLDSDDKYSDNGIKIIKDIIHNNNSYDIIQFSSIYVNNAGEIIDRIEGTPCQLCGQEQIWDYHFNKFLYPGLSVRAFRKELFDDIELLNQNIGIDDLITSQIMRKVTNLRIIDNIIYKALSHSSSVSACRESASYLNDSFRVYSTLLDKFKDDNPIFLHFLEEKYCKLVLSYYNKALYNIIEPTPEQVINISQFKEKSDRFRGFEDCFRRDKKQKIMMFLFLHNKSVYNVLVKMLFARKMMNK